MRKDYFRILCERKIPLAEAIERDIHLRDYNGRIVLLGEKDIERIYNLEEKTNIPEIRASKEKIVSRFRKSNQMLGFEVNGQRLVGSVAWRYAIFSPENPEGFPKNFKEYSTPGTFPPVDFNAMFHYGINIDPKTRKDRLGSQICKSLFDALFSQGKVSGCDYFVSDPRLHTYNGSQKNPEIERFNQDPKMREAVDKAIKGEKEFTLEDALRDPALRIYHKLTGKDIKLLKLMPNSWFPPDIPSGGYGVIVYKELK